MVVIYYYQQLKCYFWFCKNKFELSSQLIFNIINKFVFIFILIILISFKLTGEVMFQLSKLTVLVLVDKFESKQISQVNLKVADLKTAIIYLGYLPLYQ